MWLCKLNERGMLRRSFVPPQPVRDLRALTRTRARLAQDQARHQARVEKILEDALLKISVAISDLFGTSGRRFLDALVAGERSPAALAALGDKRLRATRAELAEALTGRFRDIHATEIAVHLRLIDAINAEIGLLDERIEQQLALVPGTAPAAPRAGWPAAATSPAAATAALNPWAWPAGWGRSPESAPSTGGPSSPNSAPTPPSSPPPGTPPDGHG